jgi:tRNA-dihydrouridine synthase A
LSPKENREIPPLRYDIVRRLKEDFPQLPIVLNGGVRDTKTACDMLEWCDGVMLGREAYHRPYFLAELHQRIFPDAFQPNLSREAMLERMARYAERAVAQGERLSSITRHMLGLFAGEPGAKEYRRLLSEGARAPTATPALIRRAATLGQPERATA